MKGADVLSCNIQARIISAAIEDTLVLANNRNISFLNIKRINALETELILKHRDFEKLKEIVEHAGGNIKEIKKVGTLWTLFSLRKRPVLLLGMALFIFLVFYVPSIILFVQVENNQIIPDRVILDCAQQIGIGFGASRSYIRSEKIKNALLTAVPELQWVGVNTYGCVAVISVKERNAEYAEKQMKLGSIIAKCDAVVDEITVKRGNLLCGIGQAVTKGQILVSGYTDCGISIRATAADAEIYGKTFYELDLITPTIYTVRTQSKFSRERYSIFFGKKQIKLYKDSGISDAGCVKIYSSNYLSLPGGYTLPIGILKETITFYDTASMALPKDNAYNLATTYGDRYIKEIMVAGNVLRSTQILQKSSKLYKFTCKYFCRELIGEFYKEEILDGYR